MSQSRRFTFSFHLALSERKWNTPRKKLFVCFINGWHNLSNEESKFLPRIDVFLAGNSSYNRFWSHVWLFEEHSFESKIDCSWKSPSSRFSRLVWRNVTSVSVCEIGVMAFTYRHEKEKNRITKTSSRRWPYGLRNIYWYVQYNSFEYCCTEDIQKFTIISIDVSKNVI